MRTVQITAESKQKRTHLKIAGVINEHFNWANAVWNGPNTGFSEDIAVDLSEVEKTNSHGLKNFRSNIPPSPFDSQIPARKISFYAVSPEFLDQILMLPFLSKGCTIESFIARYLCSKCGLVSQEMNHRQDLDSSAKVRQKSRQMLGCEGDGCSGKMELDSQNEPEIFWDTLALRLGLTTA